MIFVRFTNSTNIKNLIILSALVKFQDDRTINLPALNRADLTEAGYNLVEKQSRSLWIEDSIL
ncbi:MAG: hypothetical protein ACJ71H_00345, partial [Nitrososphaeraceae archaeon]